jgi:hypothetical protein
LPLSALLARPDVDQKSALRVLCGGQLRFNACQQLSLPDPAARQL